MFVYTNFVRVINYTLMEWLKLWTGIKHSIGAFWYLRLIFIANTFRAHMQSCFNKMLIITCLYACTLKSGHVLIAFNAQHIHSGRWWSGHLTKLTNLSLESMIHIHNLKGFHFNMRPVHISSRLPFKRLHAARINFQNKTKKKEMGIRFAQHIGIDYHFDQGDHFEWPYYMLVTKPNADCDCEPTKNPMIPYLKSNVIGKCHRPWAAHWIFFTVSINITSMRLSLMD